MSLRRRDVMVGATAVALSTPAAGAPAADAVLQRTFDDIANAILADEPETATFLGLDKAARAGLKARLSDQSWAHVGADPQRCRNWLARLKAVPAARLSPDAALNRQVVTAALELGAGGGRFQFGQNTLQASQTESVTPYVVNQMMGCFVTIPEMLDSQHSIETKADAEAYVSRMEAFAASLDGETARVDRDAGHGVVAPDFILSNAVGQMESFLKLPPARQRLVSSLARRARARGIAGDWAGHATRITQEKVYPAVARQLAALKRAQAKSTAHAGVWKLPDGEAYYAWALEVGTTTTMAADEVHQMGLEQNAQIEARMDGLLRKQGLSKGSVGARMDALSRDRRFLYPETDVGRAQIIAHLNDLIAQTRKRMPELSALKLKAPVMVKRVPPDIQDGAALGYMNPGALDGSRPSIYYINLKSNANWPRYSLPTLTHHETIPGHAWQGAYITETGKLPLIRQILSGFNAYVEGWALYAEQLTDEIGMYRDDPFGQLGYLAAQKMRAGRLVVDTGIHSRRWTRRRAVAWFHECTGDPIGSVISEVDRYCVSPGQACGYKVGHSELLRLRARMKAMVGPKFDLRDYNDTVVKTGAVPLTVLARVIDEHAAVLKG
ncbi:MAG TPA: DUF885 family protein [Rhizomicrobium sp.]|nr:DUF885 family protein [Rhizomicrobium sp.]